jgi:CO/xanthine dehydrogenase FAD-binding subunit
MVRLVELASAQALSPLHKAVASIGGPAIRNMATVGGNICARHPYGDLATLLLALDAQLSFSTTRGTEVIDLAAFYAAEDRPRRARLIVSVQFQLPAFQEVVFQKLGRRCVNTPSIVTVAARITRNSAGVVDRACVALGGVGDNPMRSYAAEEALIGKALDDESIGSAAQKAAAGIAPLTDSYASAWYRSRVIPIQVRRALSELKAVAT